MSQLIRIAYLPSVLRETLVDLNSYHETVSKRLDSTYYAVLERLGSLQATLIGLKELAGLSRQVGERFDVDSQAMVDNISQQLDAFGQFDDQQARIRELQSRIQTGRDKVSTLSGRVDIVRERVEAWERADHDWRNQTRKRLRTLWMIMIVIGCLFMLLYFGSMYAPFAGSTGPDGAPITAGVDGRPSWSEITGHSSRQAPNMTEEVLKELRKRGGSLATKADEAVLRVFDEL